MTDLTELKQRVAEWKAQRDFFYNETCNATFADVAVGERFQLWQGGNIIEATREADFCGSWGGNLRATNASVNGKMISVRDDEPVKRASKRMVFAQHADGDFEYEAPYFFSNGGY